MHTLYIVQTRSTLRTFAFVESRKGYLNQSKRFEYSKKTLHSYDTIFNPIGVMKQGTSNQLIEVHNLHTSNSENARDTFRSVEGVLGDGVSADRGRHPTHSHTPHTLHTWDTFRTLHLWRRRGTVTTAAPQASLTHLTFVHTWESHKHAHTQTHRHTQTHTHAHTQRWTTLT